MPEYFALSREDQREALLVAAERSGRPLHLHVLLQRCQALALKVNAAALGAT